MKKPTPISFSEREATHDSLLETYTHAVEADLDDGVLDQLQLELFRQLPVLHRSVKSSSAPSRSSALLPRS